MGKLRSKNCCAPPQYRVKLFVLFALYRKGGRSGVSVPHVIKLRINFVRLPPPPSVWLELCLPHPNFEQVKLDLPWTHPTPSRCVAPLSIINNLKLRIDNR